MAGQYCRSSSSESAVPMIRASPRAGASANCKLALVGGVSVLCSLAITAGMVVHFTREIAKIKNQNVPQDLWCLNNPTKFEELISTETEDLSDQFTKDPCWKLTNNIKLLVNKVVDHTNKKRVIKDVMDNLPVDVFKTAAEFDDKPAYHSSAHLTVQSESQQGMSHYADQSCRHLVKWGFEKGLAYVQNMTINHGKLRVSETGKYYIYAQTYFRYQHKAVADDADFSEIPNEQQLVQCIYRMTPIYASPILLMKGVGTKCWAANAEYGLNSIYQGGLFQLNAGDEIFVTVSDIRLMDDDDGSSSYFGSFRLSV